MQDENFEPIKEWQQTPTGYYIVPDDQLDVKPSRDRRILRELEQRHGG
jgi:hypothetical protein